LKSSIERILKTIFAILFTLIVSVAGAQQPKPDTVLRDTVKNRYLPTGIRFGTDALALVKSNVQDDFKGWEMNADIDFHRYFLAFDYGTWARTFPDDSAGYRNDGKYWRIGADVNFLKKDPERNMFFIGFRYGRSTFSENMNIIAEDPVWGTVTRDYTNTDVKARWTELTTGIRVKIWKIIWMGYTARFKFWLKADDNTAMLPHDVPGFGRTDKDVYWGFNYQIFIRIPFRKMPQLPPSKK
jgi:hypothetical protein